MLEYSFVKQVGFILALAAALETSSMAQAAPMTFRFDAEVASVSTIGNGADLPHPINVGDALFADYSYVSSSPGLNHPQFSSFSLTYANTSYSAPAYSITTRNDYAKWIPYQGSLADPGRAPTDDRGGGGVSDVIWIGSPSGSFGVFDTELAGSSNGIGWSIATLFAGNPALLNAELVPANPETWNAMEFKELSIVFSNGGFGNSRIGAYITKVYVVPEPNNQYVIGIVLMACAFFPWLEINGSNLIIT